MRRLWALCILLVVSSATGCGGAGQTTSAELGDDDAIAPATEGFVTLSNAACALRVDGFVECWEPASGKVLSPPALGGSYAGIAARGTPCGVTNDGAVDCVSSLAPADLTFSSVSGSCGLTADGAIICWDGSEIGTINKSFSQLSADYPRVCALDTNGRASCYQTPGSTTSDEEPPRNVNFDQISVSTNYACGITATKSLECWGQPFDGVTEPPNGTFITLTSGDVDACAIAEDMSIVCWGHYASAGSLKIPRGTDFVDLTFLDSSQSVCGLHASGTISCEPGPDRSGDMAYGVSATATLDTAAYEQAKAIHQFRAAVHNTCISFRERLVAIAGLQVLPDSSPDNGISADQVAIEMFGGTMAALSKCCPPQVRSTHAASAGESGSSSSMPLASV